MQEALRELRSLAVDRYEVLGPLGRDQVGEFAFLAREISRDRLVVLKRSPSADGGITVIERLDSSVPPPSGACPVCQTPFSGWNPSCTDCGADLAGSIGTPGWGTSREQLLAAVREAAVGYEVLGDMPRAAGGTNVYFARESSGGTIVVLRLEPENGPGKQSRFTVTATRMMRPKLLYGTVGGESRESGRAPWTPAPLSAGHGVSGGGVRTPSSPFAGGSQAERICPQCGETFGPELRFCPRDGASLRAKEPSQDLVGRVIAERYHILAKLGEGGMGRVYLAEHVRMGRRCAVKVMNPRLLYDPDSVSRFNREAANASGINHPNVVAIYDFGESDDLVYLAMEFVEGESLAALLQRNHALPERQAAEIARQVADGLSAAHELGIVHRDLKPDNVMVTRSRSGRDVIKVVDFGIAKATRGGRQTVTRTGYVVGTPAYMSPEQILGDALDARSDIYSLGCMLYEMLTGERAFADASGEVSIRQRLTEPPPRPRRVKRGLSPKLDGIVTTAMARVPDQRFQSAARLRDELAVVVNLAGGSSWSGWLPWRRARVSSSEHAPTSPHSAERRPVSGAEGVASPQRPYTAPVPVGWTDVKRPPPPLQPAPPDRATTLLRHRSARATGGKGKALWWGLAAGCVAVGLLVRVLWQLLSPAPPANEEAAPIVLPPPNPLPPGPPAPDTVATAPAAGTIWFAEPPPVEARITVDGVETDLAMDGSLSLPPGPHTIRLEAPNFRSVTRSLVVGSGKTDTLRLRLEPAVPAEPRGRELAPREPAPAVEPKQPPPSRSVGRIVVTGSIPPDAEISVNGQALPPGERALDVPPGVHTLRLSAPGYRPDSSVVEVGPGAEIQWAAPYLALIPRPEPVLTVLILTPDTTLRAGAVVRLEAGVKDESGTYLDRRISWESSNPVVAAVEPDGKLTARGPGRAYVRARSGDGTDSILVTVPAPPKPPPPPRVAVRPPVPTAKPVPATPTPDDVQKAVTACIGAFGSGNETQIVETYQAKSAMDIENLRKILAMALKDEAEFGAQELESGPQALAGADKAEVPLQLRFTWRNNLGVNKKKEVPFRVELAKTATGWRFGGCRATEKLGL